MNTNYIPRLSVSDNDFFDSESLNRDLGLFQFQNHRIRYTLNNIYFINNDFWINHYQSICHTRERNKNN